MANPKFTSVESMLDYLPAHEREVTSWLRTLILDAIPDVKEIMSYNVPFYKRHKNICYLWPGGVLWGKKRTYEGVRFGFLKGNMLTDPYQLLQKGDRKYVYWLELEKVGEVEDRILQEYIFEAALLDTR